MTTTLIAGCGDLGSDLGQRLAAAGDTVYGLKRRPVNLPTGIQPLAADLADPASLQLPESIDRVVYIVAADSFDEDAYRLAYRDGVQHLLQALHGQRLQRLLLVSSTSVYGELDGALVDETTPADSERFSGQLIRAGEELVWASGWPGVVIRFGGIYGPGRTRLIDSVRDGTARCVPGVYSNRIHRDDAVAALHHLLNLADPAPLYLGVDCTPTPQCQVLHWIAQQLGVPGPQHADGQAAQERAMRGNKRINNARLLASGFQFRYPSFQDGYGALLALKTPHR